MIRPALRPFALAALAALSPLARDSDLSSPAGMSDLRSVLPEDLPEAPAPHQAPLEEPLDETEYLVGPGDELQVYVGKAYNLRVSPESYLLFPGEPPIRLEGLTLAQAKRAIRDSLGGHFKKDLIHVMLRQTKSIKVAVVGEANKPGLYVVPANSRLSEVLAKADGFAKTAQVPYVRVIGTDDSARSYNLGAYFRTGDRSNNPYLRQGEKLLIPRIESGRPRAEILIGKTSYYYQLGERRALGEIITEMLGFARETDLRGVRLNSGKVMVGADLLGYFPTDGDIIELLGRDLRVYVEGEVGRPTVYAYVEGNSVRDYIAEAGMSSASQYQGKIRVVRADGRVDHIDLASREVHPGDHLHVARSGYATFKEFLTTGNTVIATLGSIASIYFTFLYIRETTRDN